MNIDKTKTRLPISMAFSLLLHLLVFFLIQHYLSSDSQLIEKKSAPLVVRLQQLAPPKVPLPHVNKIITTTLPTHLKVAQSTPPSPPEKTPQPPTSRINGTHTDPDEKITGVAMLGKVAPLFSGFQPEGNAFFQARHEQQEVARTHYQQAQEAQARQRSEQQAQALTIQILQILTSLLQKNPALTGKCTLVDINAGLTHLKCDSPKLFERIRSEEGNLVGILNLLRNMGKIYTGFSAAQVDGQLHITFTNEN